MITAVVDCSTATKRLPPAATRPVRQPPPAAATGPTATTSRRISGVQRHPQLWQLSAAGLAHTHVLTLATPRCRTCPHLPRARETNDSNAAQDDSTDNVRRPMMTVVVQQRHAAAPLPVCCCAKRTRSRRSRRESDGRNASDVGRDWRTSRRPSRRRGSRTGGADSIVSMAAGHIRVDSCQGPRGGGSISAPCRDQRPLPSVAFHALAFHGGGCCSMPRRPTCEASEQAPRCPRGRQSLVLF